MRWIPWQDVMTFLLPPVVYTGLCIGAVFTHQEWTPVKAVIMVGVGAAMYSIAVLVVMRRRLQMPTFVTRMGTRVWTEVHAVKPEDVADAMCFYAANVGRAHKRLDESTILSLFASAQVEFTLGPSWYGERKYAGLQKGKAVRVTWLGGFGNNAFFHELHHMVDEMLLTVKPDYKHERMDWWDMIPKLKQGWRDGPKKGT